MTGPREVEQEGGHGALLAGKGADAWARAEGEGAQVGDGRRPARAEQGSARHEREARSRLAEVDGRPVTRPTLAGGGQPAGRGRRTGEEGSQLGAEG